MRHKLTLSPALFALALGIALLAWLAFGNMQEFRDNAPPSDEQAGQDLPRVEVRLSRAEAYSPHLTLQGQLEPRHDVTLRPSLSGTVARLPQAQGTRVAQGDVLVELEQEDLDAQLARAKADLELRQAELEAGQRLRSRELVAGNELLRLQSALATAKAELASLRQQQANLRIVAPFAGTLDRLDIDEGDYVQAGEDIGRLIEIDQLTAEAWAPQRRALALEEGLPVTAILLDGSTLQGELSYIASGANEATRSYALEANIANPERRRIAGASATLEIALPERQAHRLSPARLVLDEQGQLGVKHLAPDDTVEFTPVSLISADATQAWVAGLPEEVRLITLGGGFVDNGDAVVPVPADTEEERS
ncbi:multidrug efflux system membrane fusion protein [Modicisalibacter xianhensis]|uniref:Multidrug efflux system membrane fusion protein n=1 Tax=Modicisalibacter xianhensis TaxID=442341 RepID=A0A4R8G0Q5_9GAMM|nr:efflux RND transporter periplasmic adaptor subunit [Halomonas xianhensis]TDX33039.1 multidrug efflux system membrane fusion protein [Halomonas xianhensis]